MQTVTSEKNKDKNQIIYNQTAEWNFEIIHYHAIGIKAGACSKLQTAPAY